MFSRGTASRLFAAAAAVLLAGAAACDLTEVRTTPGDDVIVVEGVLDASFDVQSILLHRSLQGNVAEGVPDARVTVTDDRGTEHAFFGQEAGCYQVATRYVDEDSLTFRGTCYFSDLADKGWVRPGGTYDLRVETPDGRVIRGRTHVPGDFRLTTVPSETDPFGDSPCSLAPDSAFPLLWTRAANAAGYLSALRASHLDGIMGRGFYVPESLELRGVSVSESDTSIVLPTEFGVFERFDYSDELLKAIANGFPEGTLVDVAVSAADRNWVTSARGGPFNPSGQIRVSTVVGDGVGVFGSLVRKRAFVVVQKRTPLPRCGVVSA
jgi:hypothetical protein